MTRHVARLGPAGLSLAGWGDLAARSSSIPPSPRASGLGRIPEGCLCNVDLVVDPLVLFLWVSAHFNIFFFPGA